MFHTRTRTHSHTHISPKSSLEEGPYSDFSMKCLFFRVASNVTTHYFYTEQICCWTSRAPGTVCRIFAVCCMHSTADGGHWSKNFTCYRVTATYYPLSGLFNFLYGKRQEFYLKDAPEDQYLWIYNDASRFYGVQRTFLRKMLLDTITNSFLGSTFNVFSLSHKDLTKLKMCIYLFCNFSERFNCKGNVKSMYSDYASGIAFLIKIQSLK